MTVGHAGRVLIAGALGTILALSLTMVVPGVSQGADVSFSDSIPVTNTDWVTPPAPPDPLVFPQFDPALGELQSVTLTLVGTVDGEFAVENTSTSQNSTATLNLAAAISVDSLDPGVGALAVLPTNSQTANLDVFDGTIDFGGPSGATFPDLTATGTTTATLTDVATLALYTGTGTVTLPATAQARSNFTGGGNIVGQFTTNAGVAVTVEYTFETNPAIDIEKATNGQDADSPTGPAISVGGPVNWAYVATNTGNVPLTQVTVVDDQGVAVTCPQDTLAVGESMTCTANGTAKAGQYANVGTVTGFYPPNEQTVTDKDPSHYIGETPQIVIKKFTNGDPGDDVNCVDGPKLSVGDPVTWTYVVTNPGDVPLSGVVVNDDKLGVIPGPDSGDANNNNLLDPGETWTYSAKGVAVVGQYNNVGDVKGISPGQQTVVDEDPSCYIATQVLQATPTTTTTTTVAATAATLPATGPHNNLGPISAVGIGLVALGGLLVVTARRPSQVEEDINKE